MYKIYDEVINIITKAVGNGKVELVAKGKTLAKVKIQKGIFHGDSLTPQIFL